MKITHTLAALSAVAILIAGPSALAERHEGGGGAQQGGMQSGGAQQGGGQQGGGMQQGAPGAGGGMEGGADTGGMGASGAGGGAQNLSREQIREMQQALKDKGHDVGAVDGVWGPMTQNALREYQQAQGMTASGEPDSQTMSSLGVSGSAVGAPGGGEQPSPEAGGAPGGGGASEDAGPGAGTPTPDAGGASSGGGASPDAGPGAAPSGG